MKTEAKPLFTLTCDLLSGLPANLQPLAAMWATTLKEQLAGMDPIPFTVTPTFEDGLLQLKFIRTPEIPPGARLGLVPDEEDGEVVPPPLCGTCNHLYDEHMRQGPCTFSDGGVIACACVAYGPRL